LPFKKLSITFTGLTHFLPVMFFGPASFTLNVISWINHLMQMLIHR